MTALMALLPCLLLACKDDTPTDTSDTEDTAETGLETATLTWDLAPDPGLAAPDAVAVRVAGGEWESVSATGEMSLANDATTYELAMACVPSKGQPRIILISATAAELPSPRMACPWLDEDQQVDVELTVSELGAGQTALVGVGRESALVIADGPKRTVQPVAGAQDVTLAYSSVLSTGRSTFSMDVQRQQDISAGSLTIPSSGLVSTTQKTATAPAHSLNGVEVSLSTTVSLWTSGGTLGELGAGFSAEVSYGYPPAGLRAEGDMILVSAVADDGEHGIVSVSPPGEEFWYDGVDGESLVGLTNEGGAAVLEWVAHCGYLGWFPVSTISPSEGALWTVFVQPERGGADPVEVSYTLPDLAALPGFDTEWATGSFEPADVLGGNFVVQVPDGDASPAEFAAGMLLSVVGPGSGLVGPAELLGTESALMAARVVAPPE